VRRELPPLAGEPQLLHGLLHPLRQPGQEARLLPDGRPHHADAARRWEGAHSDELQLEGRQGGRGGDERLGGGVGHAPVDLVPEELQREVHGGRARPADLRVVPQHVVELALCRGQGVEHPQRQVAGDEATDGLDHVAPPDARSMIHDRSRVAQRRTGLGSGHESG